MVIILSLIGALLMVVFSTLAGQAIAKKENGAAAFYFTVGAIVFYFTFFILGVE